MNIILIIKGAYAIGLFIIILFTGIIPLRVKYFSQNQKFISLTSAFSGGLFLSISLIHLIPQSHSNIQKYFENGSNTNHFNSIEQHKNQNESPHIENSTSNNQSQQKEQQFPFSMLIAILSYSIILMLEKVITLNEMNLKSDAKAVNFENTKVIPQQINQIKENEIEKKDENIQKSIIDQNEVKSIDVTQALFVSQSLKVNPSSAIMKIQPQPSIDTFGNKSQQQKNQEQQQQMKCIEMNDRKDQYLNEDNSKFKSIDIKQEKPPFNSRKKKGQLRQKQFNIIEVVVLQLTFGLHGVLEGISIGVQHKFICLLVIGCSVIIHKLTSGIILGIYLSNTNLNIKNSVFMVLFQSLMSPFGIFIGWIFSQQSHLIIGILLGVNAGTFLYISTNDIVAQEFKLKRYIIGKYLLFLIGIAIISGFWFLSNQLRSIH